VLFNDELAAEWNHEEDAQPASEEGESEDAGGLEIEAEEDQRRKGEDDARGDGLAGVAGGLDDVVFEDGGSSEGAQDRDGEHRDRNGGGDGESRTKADIDRDSAEENPEDSSEEERADGELRTRVGCGDEGGEGGSGKSRHR
jgi:hypothetical protein